MKYYAHSENDRHEKHLLSDHLCETAKFTESFTWKLAYKPVFYLAGLMHDLGKYQREFQRYLETGGKRGSVPHASWGAGWSRLRRLIEASVAIDGHHKGLPNNSAWKSDTEPFRREEVEGFHEIVKTFLSDLGIEIDSFNALESLSFSDASEREIFIRYLFSALTDSDWLSTEKHFNKIAFDTRSSLVLPVDELISKLEMEFSKKPRNGTINLMRNETRFQALQKADMPCGFYSLALPTGMGKTLTSMAWALNHAKKNRLKRIIVVLPFVNIIDQTAQILKEIFGDDWVLEHHSGYNEDEKTIGENEKNYSVIEQRKKLACENWDYPIIVTTTVQFFESLFSNRPSRCRKVHNIAESVVIFDEVQTLPKEVVLPTLQMLKNVLPIMKTSFLFCTATQPAFEKRENFDGIDNITPLIENPDELYEGTKRVKYYFINDLSPVDSGRLLEIASQETKSILVIFNTKKAALEFYNSAKNNQCRERQYHLSTAMCPSHRKNVIENIRTDLKAGKNILVSSTQLIEAGVDFDFPVVFRAIAPLEAIIQAAGRCNRENKLGKSGGKVFLFKLFDSGMPDKTYAACATHAEEFLRTDMNQLHDWRAFNKYYSQVVRLYVDPDRYKVNTARGQFNFQVVNDSYHIIRNQTDPLFVFQFNDESRSLFHAVEHKKFLSREDFRKLQPYTVQVYKHFLLQHAKLCKLMPQGFTVWYGGYDMDTGISVEPLDADKMVV
jgi:CRISPR-associated endonuclease/helicase Cas3